MTPPNSKKRITLREFLDQELISYRYSHRVILVLLIIEGDLFKKAKASVFSYRIGMKFDRIGLSARAWHACSFHLTPSGVATAVEQLNHTISGHPLPDRTDFGLAVCS